MISLLSNNIGVFATVLLAYTAFAYKEPEKASLLSSILVLLSFVAVLIAATVVCMNVSFMYPFSETMTISDYTSSNINSGYRFLVASATITFLLIILSALILSITRLIQGDRYWWKSLFTFWDEFPKDEKEGEG